MKLTPKGKTNFAATYDLDSGGDGVVEFILSAVTQSGKQLQEIRQFPVHRISAKRGGSVSYGKNASMMFPAGALYQDIFSNIFPTTQYTLTKGLPLIGEVYDFRPAGEPLEKKGSVQIHYPADVQNPQKLGIFWWDSIKQRWYFMDDKRNPKTRSLSTKIIYPSIYAILQDDLNPTISDLSPESGNAVSAANLTLSGLIKDVGKGVDEDSIVVLLDGTKMDAEYDPDRDKVSYSLTKKLISGKHTLEIRASDKAGNSATSKTSTFTAK